MRVVSAGKDRETVVASASRTHQIAVLAGTALLRTGVTLAVDSLPGLQVTVQAATVAEIAEAQRRQTVDSILVECLSNPDAGCRQAADLVQAGGPGVIILVDTQLPNVALHAGQAIRAGVRGIVADASDLDEIARAVRAVAEGGTYVSPHLSDAVFAALGAPAWEGRSAAGAAAGPGAGATAASAAGTASVLERLSERERQVMDRVREGWSTSEIAAALTISPKTVAQHKTNIVKKLRLRSARDLPYVAVTGARPARLSA